MQNVSHESRLQPAVGYSDTVTVVWQIFVEVGAAVRGEVEAWTAMALLATLLSIRRACSVGIVNRIRLQYLCSYPCRNPHDELSAVNWSSRYIVACATSFSYTVMVKSYRKLMALGRLTTILYILPWGSA